MSDTLWAVNIHGPDDVVPVASYSDALSVANAFNGWWESLKASYPLQENDPRMWAVPVEYDGDPEQHAWWVRNPSPDYRTFFPADEAATEEGE